MKAASDIWFPLESDRMWLKALFESLSENGTWIAPVTGQEFVKKGDALIWVNEHIEDTSEIYHRSKVIGQEIGIDVIKESEL